MLELNSEPLTTLWQLPLSQPTKQADPGAGMKRGEPWAPCPSTVLKATSKVTFIPAITEHRQKGQTLCAGNVYVKPQITC